MINFKMPEGLIPRRLERFLKYYFRIIYRSGRKYNNTDIYSRRLSLEQQEKKELVLNGSKFQNLINLLKPSSMIPNMFVREPRWYAFGAPINPTESTQG